MGDRGSLTQRASSTLWGPGTQEENKRVRDSVGTFKPPNNKIRRMTTAEEAASDSKVIIRREKASFSQDRALPAQLGSKYKVV